jgi:hypothetical protein
MIIVRIVRQAHVGQGASLAAALTEGNRQLSEGLDLPHRWRVLTDRTGQQDTVVFEAELESLANFEEVRARIFASPQFAELTARTQGLVASGTTEIYAVEAESSRV